MIEIRQGIDYKIVMESEIRRALDLSAIVAITDPSGTITHVNDKFCEISGYDREELLGKNNRILNSGLHGRDFFIDMWRTISQGKKWEGEIRNRNKAGHYYWVHTVIVPTLDENKRVREYISIRYEITKLKQAEESIRQSKENMQSLIDSSFAGLLIYDLSANVQWVNLLTADILAKSEAELVGQSVEALLGEAYQPFVPGEIQLKLKVGEVSRFLEVSTKHYHYLGRVAYLVNIRDITAKVQMESQILQQDRLASVGLLASGLAHEIGTPLGIMRGRAEMMMMDKSAGESVKNSSSIIVQQIDRISHLIQNLLKLARGSQSESLGPVHVLSVLSDVADFLQHEIKKKNIELDVEVLEDLEVNASSSPLFQVFLNLLVNAVHAIEERRQIQQLGGHLKVTSRVQGEFKEIIFEDDGVGMSEDQLKKLFTPFFTTKDVGKGTGLGLATSYKIIQGWGGFISVSSTQGQGSRFTIHLPRD